MDTLLRLLLPGYLVMTFTSNFQTLKGTKSEVNDPILLKIKLDRDFMPILDICEIEADLKKIEAATVMTKFFSC